MALDRQSPRTDHCWHGESCRHLALIIGVVPAVVKQILDLFLCLGSGIWGFGWAQEAFRAGDLRAIGVRWEDRAGASQTLPRTWRQGIHWRHYSSATARRGARAVRRADSAVTLLSIRDGCGGTVTRSRKSLVPSGADGPRTKRGSGVDKRDVQLIRCPYPCLCAWRPRRQ